MYIVSNISYRRRRRRRTLKQQMPLASGAASPADNNHLRGRKGLHPPGAGQPTSLELLDPAFRQGWVRGDGFFPGGAG